MSWIQAHQELGSHYKTKRLARTLDITVPQAVGHVMLLWWWCVDYAPDGNLEGFDHVEIAEAAQWPGDPEAFVEALQGCGRIGPGFLDGLKINDWAEYTDGYKKLQEAGVKGNHKRWHQGRGVIDSDCVWCLTTSAIEPSDWSESDPLPHPYPRFPGSVEFADLARPESPPDSPPTSPPISGGTSEQHKPTQPDTVSGRIAPDVAPESEERRGEEKKPPPTPPKGGDGDEESSTPDPDEVEQWVAKWATREFADRMLTPQLEAKWKAQVSKFIEQYGSPTHGILRRAHEAGISHPAGWEWHIPADRKPATKEQVAAGCDALGHVWADLEDERICARCKTRVPK